MSCSAKVLKCLMEYYDEETQPSLAYRYIQAEIETVEELEKMKNKRCRI